MNLQKKTRYFLIIRRLILFCGIIFPLCTFAVSNKTTYQAKIIKPDGNPLEATSVNFKFTILDPSASCILYAEEYSAVNMNGTGGLIFFSLGSGNRTYPASGGSTLASVFDNSVVSFPCQSPGLYPPTSADNRKIVMQFNDGTGWQTLPAMAINSVPFSMYAGKADNSTQLNGKSDTAFVENSTLAALNCNPATHAITFNGVSFSCIAVGGGGGGGGINSVTTSGTVLSTGGTASAPVISIMAATMSQDGYLTSLDYAEFKAKLSASSTQIVNTLGFAPVSGAAVATQINNSNLSGDVSGTILSNSVVSVGGKTSAQVSTSVNDTLAASASNVTNTIVKRDSSGNSSFAGISASAASLNYVDIYKPSTSFNIRLQAPTSLAANYTLMLPTSSGTSGQVLSTDGSGNLSWVNPANGSVTSVSATAPLVSTGGSTPTISITQATSSTNGYLSSADFSTFNNKQNATSAAIIATLGYTPATSTTLAASFVQKAGDTMTGLLNLPSNGLAVGTNQLVVSGSSVGIGVLNPTAALQLKAGTTSNAPLKFTSGTLLSSAQSGTIEYDGSQLYFTDGASIRRAIATNSSQGSFDNTSSISNTSGNITLSPNNITGSVIVNSSQASISSGTGALVVNGGLGVAGSINAGGNLNLTGSANIGQSLQLPSMTSGSLLFAGASGLVSEDNSRLFWDGANKRLGLGTNSPAQTLSVSGASYFSGNVGVGTTTPTVKLDLRGIGTNGGGGITGFVISHAGSMAGDGAGIEFTYQNTAAGTTGNIARILPIVEGGGGGDLLFQTAPNNTGAYGTKMIIKRDGNVGIGTTAPINRLNVMSDGTAVAGAQLLLQGATNTNHKMFIGFDTTSNYGFIQPVTEGTAYRNLALNPNGGNVGIGTTTPTSQLHLYGGNVNFQLDDGNGIANFQKTSTDLRIATQTALPIWFATNGTERVRVDSTGNVGIGTTSPAVALDVAGVGGAISLSGSGVASPSTGLVYGIFPQSGRGLGLYSAAAGAGQGIGVWTNKNGTTPTEVMTILRDGNVGIGTTAPAKKLDVNGDINLGNTTGNSALTIISNATTGLSRLVMDPGTGNNRGFLDYDNSSRAMILRTNEVERMRIDTSGNVGIGTMSPTTKLEISSAGNQQATGVYVDRSVGYATGASTTLRGFYVNQRGANDTVNNIGIESYVIHNTGEPSVAIKGTADGIVYNNTGLQGIGVHGIAKQTEMNGLGRAIGVKGEVSGVGSGANGWTYAGYFDNTTAIAGNNYGLYVKTTSSGTYGFYQDGGVKNYFSGNVGIGVTNPSAKLELASGTASLAPLKFTSGTLLSSAQSGSFEYDGFNFYVTDSTNTRRAIAANTNPGTYDNVSNINSSSNITLTPTGSVVVSSTTASTNSSTGALVVKGGLGVAGNIYASGTIVTSSNIQGASVTATSGMISPYIAGSVASGGSLALDSTTHSTKGNILLAPNGGNVGIGTSSPTGKLQVVGSASAGGNGRTTIDSNNNTGMITLADNTGTPVIGLVNAGYNNLIGYTNADFRFSTNNADRMTITGGGNVGIGTTDPDTKFHVVGDAEITPSSGTSAVNATSTLRFKNVNLAWGSGGSQAAMIQAITTSYINDGSTANALAFSLANTGSNAAAEMMRIQSNGNVGIGTNSPIAKLHITDSIALGSGGTFDLSVFPANNPGAHNSSAVPTTMSFGGSARVTYNAVRNLANTFNDEFLTFSTHRGGISQGERMRIDPIGNVGIGTTTPGNFLHIKTNSNAIGQAQIIAEGGTGGYGAGFSMQAPLTGGSLKEMARITADGEDSWNTTAATQDAGMRLYTTLDGTTSEKVRISAAGNVGIGTSNPTTLLDIRKDTNGAEQVRIVNANAGTSAQTYFTLGNDTNVNLASIYLNGGGNTVSPYGANSLVINNGLAYPIVFTTNGTEKMRISSSGNVGIGTSTPSAKLDVAGEIKLGNTASTCNASNEGQQRYNSTVKLMEYCNGSAWYPVGGGPGQIISKTIQKNCTRWVVVPTTSIIFESFTVNKKYASSTLLIEGTISGFAGYSGSMQQQWKYGAGAEVAAQGIMYEPSTHGRIFSTAAVIEGHATTGAQTMLFKYYSAAGTDKPFLVYNPSASDDTRLTQTCSIYVVSEVAQ